MTAVASFLAVLALALMFALVTQPDAIVTEHTRADAAVATVAAQATQLAGLRFQLSTPTPHSVCAPSPHC